MINKLVKLYKQLNNNINWYEYLNKLGLKESTYYNIDNTHYFELRISNNHLFISLYYKDRLINLSSYLKRNKFV